MLQTIGNAGSVLDLFTVERSVWRLAEIAEAVELPLSTTHALLSSLVEVGLLRSRRRGVYEISWRVLEMGNGLATPTTAVQLVAPVLNALSEEVGENTHYVELRRWVARCKYRVVRNLVINVAGPQLEDVLDLPTSAVGKAILACRRPEEVRRFVLDRSAASYPAIQPASKASLMRELVEIRQVGWSVDEEGYAAGVCCVAAPVRVQMNPVLGAIGVAIPACRFSEQRRMIESAVSRAAAEISTELEKCYFQPVGRLS